MPSARVIRFLRGRSIDESTIKDLVAGNIRGIAIARSGRLRTNARKLEALFASKGEDEAHEVVNQMILKNLADFYSINFKELDEVRFFMQGRGIPESKIDHAFRGSINGMEAARKKRLESITKHMEDFFGEAGIENPKLAVDEMMLGNLANFSRINLWEFDQVVMFLKNRGISEKQIAEMASKSPEGASLSRKKRLEFVAAYMQVFYGGGDDAKLIVDEMILKSLSRFSNMDTHELDELQDYLKKRGVSKSRMQTAFRKNIEGISKINMRNLKRGAEHLEAFFLDEKNAAKIVSDIVLKDLISVSHIVPGEFDKTLDYLRTRGFPETLLHELVREEIKGLARFRLEKDRPHDQTHG